MITAKDLKAGDLFYWVTDKRAQTPASNFYLALSDSKPVLGTGSHFHLDVYVVFSKKRISGAVFFASDNLVLQ